MFQEHESARLSVAPLEFVHFRALAMAPTSPLWQGIWLRVKPSDARTPRRFGLGFV